MLKNRQKIMVTKILFGNLNFPVGRIHDGRSVVSNSCNQNFIRADNDQENSRTCIHVHVSLQTVRTYLYVYAFTRSFSSTFANILWPLRFSDDERAICLIIFSKLDFVGFRLMNNLREQDRVGPIHVFITKTRRRIVKGTLALRASPHPH